MLFPAFSHTYLNLVGMGAQAEAQTLMGEHRQRFVDAALGGSSLRIQVRACIQAAQGAGLSSQRLGNTGTPAPQGPLHPLQPLPWPPPAL